MVKFDLLAWLGTLGLPPNIPDDAVVVAAAAGDSPVHKCYAPGPRHNITLSVPRESLFDRTYNTQKMVPVWSGTSHAMSPRDNLTAVLSYHRPETATRLRTTVATVPFLHGGSGGGGLDGYVDFEFGVLYDNATPPADLSLTIEIDSPEDPWHRLPPQQYGTRFAGYLVLRGQGGNEGGGVRCH